MRNCPLCKINDSATYMKPTAWNNRDKIELRKCKRCSFVFSAASLCDYSYVGAQHLTTTKEEMLALARKQHLPQLAHEIVEKTGLKQGKILDFGCGIGLLALCMKEKGFNAYGIEQSKTFLQKHKEFDIVSAESLSSFDAEKNNFDLIIMKDVLEHVDEPVELLGHVASYIKPSGYLYIRVPNVYHYPFHWSIDTKSHVNHFSPKKLVQLLEKNNLKKINFVGVYDISTTVGKVYNSVFWRTRHILPMYHQISLLCQKR